MSFVEGTHIRTSTDCLMESVFMARPKGSKNKKNRKDSLIDKTLISNNEAMEIVEAKEEKIKQVNPYILTVKVLGKLWKSTGETFEEAINNLNIKNAKGMSVWKLGYSGLLKEKIVAPLLTFRVLNTKGSIRDIALKNFKSLFGL